MSCEENVLESIFGYSALIFSLVYRIPQLVKLYKTRKGNDISSMMLFVQNISYIFYIIYSILRIDIVILVGSIISFFQNVTIYIMKKRYQKEEEQFKNNIENISMTV